MPVTTKTAALAGLGDGALALDDAVTEQVYRAAEDYVARRCRWPTADSLGQPVDAPDALVTAVHLLTSRLLERRNSPSGVLGSGDFGVVRVSGSDRDVDALMAPWRKLPIG